MSGILKLFKKDEVSEEPSPLELRYKPVEAVADKVDVGDPLAPQAKDAPRRPTVTRRGGRGGAAAGKGSARAKTPRRGAGGGGSQGEERRPTANGRGRGRGRKATSSGRKPSRLAGGGGGGGKTARELELERKIREMENELNREREKDFEDPAPADSGKGGQAAGPVPDDADNWSLKAFANKDELQAERTSDNPGGAFEPIDPPPGPSSLIPASGDDEDDTGAGTGAGTGTRKRTASSNRRGRGGKGRSGRVGPGGKRKSPVSTPGVPDPDDANTGDGGLAPTLVSHAGDVNPTIAFLETSDDLTEEEIAALPQWKQRMIENRRAKAAGKPAPHAADH